MSHADTSEPNWGNPMKSQPRRDVSKGETIAGIAWLSIGILFGLFIEILYVGTRIAVSGVAVPIPWTIVFAVVFNLVISRTARLWTDSLTVAGIPLLVWSFGFILVTLWPSFGITQDQLTPQTVWSILVFIGGMAGGTWPLRPQLTPIAPPTSAS